MLLSLERVDGGIVMCTALWSTYRGMRVTSAEAEEIEQALGLVDELTEAGRVEEAIALDQVVAERLQSIRRRVS